MRVVVVGGGIVGLACAHALAERGADVAVLEKESLGGGSTGRANGGIRAQFGSPVSVDLSRESIAVWERFEAAFGVDVGYRRPGYLFLARERSTAEALAANVEMQADRGVESELLDPDAAREHCPELRADAFEAATYCPTDGFADPNLALQGFAGAAADAGVDVETGVAVSDLLVADGRVVGVVADGERRRADRVVNAAGAWGGEVAAMAGVDLPVRPKRRTLLVAEPSTPVPADVPLTADLDGGAHFRPEREGAAVVGGHFDDADPTVDPGAFDERVGVEWRATALERAGEVARYFGPDSRVRRAWAGLYAVTPDHHPVVDEAPPGLLHAVGFSGHGFMQSPATGRVVAELALDGQATTVDVSDLDAGRFERGDLLSEGTVLD
jgi:sarcosine oxidase subunit beta